MMVDDATDVIIIMMMKLTLSAIKMFKIIQLHMLFDRIVYFVAYCATQKSRSRAMQQNLPHCTIP